MPCAQRRCRSYCPPTVWATKNTSSVNNMRLIRFVTSCLSFQRGLHIHWLSIHSFMNHYEGNYLYYSACVIMMFCILSVTASGVIVQARLLQYLCSTMSVLVANERPITPLGQRKSLTVLLAAPSTYCIRVRTVCPYIHIHHCMQAVYRSSGEGKEMHVSYLRARSRTVGVHNPYEVLEDTKSLRELVT